MRRGDLVTRRDDTFALCHPVSKAPGLKYGQLARLLSKELQVQVEDFYRRDFPPITGWTPQHTIRSQAPDVDQPDLNRPEIQQQFHLK
jgi:hypothetical protein